MRLEPGLVVQVLGEDHMDQAKRERAVAGRARADMLVGAARGERAADAGRQAYGHQAGRRAALLFQVLPVVDPSEPCVIRGMDRDDGGCGNKGQLSPSICGAQVYTQKAQRTANDEQNSDTTLTARDQLLLQAGKVVSKLTPFPATSADPMLVTKGRAATTMLVLVQHNPDNANEPRRSGQLQAITPITAEDDTESGKRFDRCKAYRDSDGGSGHPFFYVGNPKQYTKPLSDRKSTRLNSSH